MFTALVLLFFVLFGPLASPWTIDVHPDLAYPPRWTDAPGDRYMYKNGSNILSPSYLTSCLNYPVPGNASRSKFHVSDGRAIFDLVNGTDGNPTNESFHLNVYLPHLYYKYVDGPEGTKYNLGVQGKYKSGRSMWRYFYWQNFPKKGRCYLPMNMTQMVVDEDGAALQSSDLVGLNATLMFPLQDARHYSVFEQVDQCAYVTLTDEDVQPVEDIPACDSYNPVSDLAKLPSSSSSKSSGVSLDKEWLLALPGVLGLALWSAT